MSMEAWVPLSKAEEDAAWEHFFADLHFPMGQHAGKEPAPSVTYSIAHAFNAGMDARVSLEDELDDKILITLKHCVPLDGRVYALDWQHMCYWFYPHRMAESGSWDAWKVPVLPDGDFYVFLAEDWSFCIFGDCINLTICIYGRCLLDTLAANLPALFTRVIRIDGQLVVHE